jgi:hypothetical protein
MRRAPCVCALCFLLAFSASSWAREPPSPGSTSEAPGLTSPPPAPASPTLGSIADRLSKLSTQLSSEADAQSTELAELSSLLEESRSALLSSQASLDKAAAEIKGQALKAGLWRDFALVAALGAGGALADPSKARGAAIGAGAGAVVALAVEAWPFLHRVFRARAAAEPKPP